MKNATTGECRLTPCVREAIEWAQAEANDFVDLKTLLSRQRYAHLVRIRRLAMWRLRTHHRKSFPWIAQALGYKDHATIMHHIELENEARLLPKDYPQAEWRAEREEALTSNIDIIAQRISAGARAHDLAHEYRIPLQRLTYAVNLYRRKAAQNLDLHNADNQQTDRIAREPVGASM